jgi:hypothetical protein
VGFAQVFEQLLPGAWGNGRYGVARDLLANRLLIGAPGSPMRIISPIIQKKVPSTHSFESVTRSIRGRFLRLQVAPQDKSSVSRTHSPTWTTLVAPSILMVICSAA